jgi:hypothetical protein
MKQPRKRTIADVIRQQPKLVYMLDLKLCDRLEFSSWIVVYNLIWTELKGIISIGVCDRIANTIPWDV